VPAEVVIATFFNFNPSLVRHAIPRAWEAATPAAILDARLEVADAALRRVIGDDVLSRPEIVTAAENTRRATERCTPDGRPLYAAHAALPWPDEPHLVLWHAITLLREFRGDGHIACLVAEGIDGCEALVQHAAAGEVSRQALQSTRAWSDDEWDAAVARLAERGLADTGGGFTEAGRALRERIEARTDELAAPPWRVLGEETCQRLRTVIRPLSRAIADSQGFGLR
jgi:hypothetical protein